MMPMVKAPMKARTVKRMLSEEDFRKFTEFRIGGMGRKLREMIDDDSYDDLTFEEKMKVLIDAESESRDTRKMQKLVKNAKFKDQGACVEDLIYLPERKLSRDRITRYAECKWIEDNEVICVISRSGCGKSFLIQALGVAACRKLIDVRYARLADIFEDLNRARLVNAEAYYEALNEYKTVSVLLCDDFLTTPIESPLNAVDLFEIMEAREGVAATIIASQLEPQEWYLRIEGELMADSTLNRIAKGARYIDIEGPNMREYVAKKRDEKEAAAKPKKK